LQPSIKQIGLDVTANGLLNGPLGMTVNPSNCNIFTANSGDGNVVITAPDGNQDPNPIVLIPGGAAGKLLIKTLHIAKSDSFLQPVVISLVLPSKTISSIGSMTGPTPSTPYPSSSNL